MLESKILSIKMLLRMQKKTSDFIYNAHYKHMDKRIDNCFLVYEIFGKGLKFNAFNYLCLVLEAIYLVTQQPVQTEGFIFIPQKKAEGQVFFINTRSKSFIDAKRLLIKSFTLATPIFSYLQTTFLVLVLFILRFFYVKVFHN